MGGTFPKKSIAFYALEFSHFSAKSLIPVNYLTVRPGEPLFKRHGLLTPDMVPPALQAKHALAASPARNERTGLEHLAYDALTAKACAELFDIIDHKLNLAANDPL